MLMRFRNGCINDSHMEQNEQVGWIPSDEPLWGATPAQIPGLSIISFILRSSESLENQNRNSDFQLPPSSSRDPPPGLVWRPMNFPEKKRNW